VVIDDHSPDPLEDVIDEFEGKINIIYKYAEKNGGPGVARQIGLETCFEEGFEYISFLDSDDLLYPQAVERLVFEIDATGCDFVSSAIWQDHGTHNGANIEATNQTWLHGKIYRAEYLKRIGASFPAIRTNEDVTFNLTAMECAEKKGHLDELLYYFRHAGDSITRKKDKDMALISTDFIAAIYNAAMNIRRIKGELTNQLIIDSFALFNHYQIALCLDIVTEEAKEQIKTLVNLPEYKNALSDPERLNNLISVTHQYHVFEGQIYVFKQTFFDWLREFADYIE
jgi:glycosyltransferase involved in cell wall biosynthesis